jgi:HD-like signal output (HDOD) protein
MEELKLSTICVDDEQSMLKATERLVHRIRPDWQALFCENPLTWRDQWSFSDIEAPAVFMAELAMVEKRGDELLQDVKRIFPDAIRVLLTAENDQSLVGKAHSFAHFVLPKPVADHDFERVFSCAERLDKMPFNDECRRNLGEFTELPLLPDTVMKLQKTLALATCDIYKIADVISHEPVLVAKLFQIANSPYFGFRRATDSLPEAVGRLGLTLVESIAFTQLSTISHKKLTIQRHAEIAEKSLRIGEVSRVLAKKLGLNLSTQDKVFIASLLTAIGALVLLEEGAAEDKLDDFIGLQPGLSDQHIIAAYVLILWGYEIEIGEIILNQGQIDFSSSQTEIVHASIVGLATRIVELNSDEERLELANTLPQPVSGIVAELVSSVVVR